VTYLPDIQRAPPALGEPLKRGALLDRQISISRSLAWPTGLQRPATESCARLRIQRDRRRKSYLGQRHYAGVLARAASVWRDLTARMTEESVTTPTVSTGQYYPSQKPVR
jgi:hypothetical protein